jgi:hypothetical protein
LTKNKLPCLQDKKKNARHSDLHICIFFPLPFFISLQTFLLNRILNYILFYSILHSANPRGFFVRIRTFFGGVSPLPTTQFALIFVDLFVFERGEFAGPQQPLNRLCQHRRNSVGAHHKKTIHVFGLTLHADFQMAGIKEPHMYCGTV